MPISDAERQRRRALLDAHYEPENDHDLDRIMETFSNEAEMIYNGQAFRGHDAIRAVHTYVGMSSTPGALRGLRNVRDHVHVTDDEIVVEGRLCGTHVGEFQGFPPTNRDVELPFVAFYRFDEDQKLASERVVMDLGSLGAGDS
jgi:predicted ester cyclase